MDEVFRRASFTQLHILIGLQERDCREQGLDWQTAPPEVGELAVAWLNGAAAFTAVEKDDLRDVAVGNRIGRQIFNRIDPNPARSKPLVIASQDRLAARPDFAEFERLIIVLSGGTGHGNRSRE